jgi:hypothetical protein
LLLVPALSFVRGHRFGLHRALGGLDDVVGLGSAL